MRKIILLLSCTLFFTSVSAQTPTEESRIFLHPFTEVYVNYPSAKLGLGVRLTVFLPEEKIPLSKSYPLVVYLGLTSQEHQLAQNLAKKEQVVIAGITWESWASQAVNDPQSVGEFLHRELLPYLETNYPILPGAEFRTLAASGETNAQAVVAQLVHSDFVGKIALVEPGNVQIPTQASTQGVRFYVQAEQAALAAVQAQLQGRGVKYGPGFVLSYPQAVKSGLAAVNFQYLNAPAKQLSIKKIEAYTQQDSIALHSQQPLGLRVAVLLKNNYWFSYIPQTLRFSPPYLAWDAPQGTLQNISGAQAGAVKISGDVDNLPFSVKIKLKKD